MGWHAGKYNGVSDACILVDKKSGDIYVAGLWDARRGLDGETREMGGRADRR